MYRLTFDSGLADQWSIDTPVNYSGDEWAFWRLLAGVPLEGADLLPWRSRATGSGRRLDFTFAGFDVPVLVNELVSEIEALVGDQVQFPELKITEETSSYKILVATRTLKCVDESISQFTKWTVSDGRPDKIGEYRMFSRLRVDPSCVPRDVSIFRIWGWRQALIVTEPIAHQLRTCMASGLVYEPVI